MNKLHRHDKKIAQLRNSPYSEDSSFVSSCMYVHLISRCQVVSRPMCVYECQCVMMLDGQLLKFSIKPAQTQVSLVFVIPISTPFGECSAARVWRAASCAAVWPRALRLAFGRARRFKTPAAHELDA